MSSLKVVILFHLFCHFRQNSCVAEFLKLLLELGSLLETHQGTGTFIADKKLEKDSPERDRQLGQMAGEFSARAGAAGFTLEDLIDRLRDLLPDKLPNKLPNKRR